VAAQAHTVLITVMAVATGHVSVPEAIKIQYGHPPYFGSKLKLKLSVTLPVTLTEIIT